MSLNYDYTQIDTRTWSGDDHERAASFAWALVSIDTREVTKKNQDEIFFRFKFLERIGMNIFREPIEDESFKDYLAKLIGYKTNVKNEPRSKFMRRWIQNVERKLKEELNAA